MVSKLDTRCNFLSLEQIVLVVQHLSSCMYGKIEKAEWPHFTLLKSAGIVCVCVCVSLSYKPGNLSFTGAIAKRHVSLTWTFWGGHFPVPGMRCQIGVQSKARQVLFHLSLLL